MYKITNISNNNIRGESMKKAIGMMALGMGFGASAMFLYDQYKSGSLTKAVSNGAKEITKAVKKIKE